VIKKGFYIIRDPNFQAKGISTEISTDELKISHLTKKLDHSPIRSSLALSSFPDVIYDLLLTGRPCNSMFKSCRTYPRMMSSRDQLPAHHSLLAVLKQKPMPVPLANCSSLVSMGKRSCRASYMSLKTAFGRGLLDFLCTFPAVE